MKRYSKCDGQIIMNNTFERVPREVPTWLMEKLRARIGDDEDDITNDKEILSMSGYSMLDEYLNWEGICGYTGEILEVIQYAFGIDLEEAPFDEPMERKKEEE